MICRRCGAPMNGSRAYEHEYPVECALEICPDCYMQWNSKCKISWVFEGIWQEKFDKFCEECDRKARKEEP